MAWAQIMRGLLPFIGAGAGAATNRNQNTNSTSTSQFTNTGSSGGMSEGASVSIPTFDPDAAGLKTQIAQRYSELMGPNLNNFATRGLMAIRDNTNRAASGLQNWLASRGIGQTAGADIGMSRIASEGANAAGAFRAQIPQMEFDNSLRALSQAGGFMSSIPTGQNTSTASNTNQTFTNTGTSNQSGSNTQQGNPLGGAVGNLALILTRLYGGN